MRLSRGRTARRLRRREIIARLIDLSQQTVDTVARLEQINLLLELQELIGIDDGGLIKRN